MTAPVPLEIATPSGTVSGLLLRPGTASLLYVLAHGAGAGMRHPFLEAVAQELAGRGIATLRYQFPYMERGLNRTDPRAVAEGTVRAAVEAARVREPELPLIAGGKSFGGRMTSQAQAKAPLPGVRGLAFLGFPLHAPGRPSESRASHLPDVAIPMLFLQGTRDPLADLTLMRRVTDGLGAPATLHVVEGGDHSFKVLKRSGRTERQVLDGLAAAIGEWGRTLC
jgi:hypothetical protein